MDWVTVSSTIFPLVGVVIGASGSIVAQYLATRVTKQQDGAKRVADLRRERKEAVRDFLDTTQAVERAAEHRFIHGDHGESPGPLTHRMWYSQKCIEIVGTPQLRQATLDYAWRLSEAIYKEVPDDMNVWDFITDRRDPFLEAARRELDIPDIMTPALKR
jgi:hypothetical protein